MKILTIPDDFAGRRADSALSDICPQSRSRLAALIKSGLVLMDGKVFKPSAIFEGGEKIEFCNVPPKLFSATPENIPLDVIFEDDDLIVVNKPPGMVVHPGAGRPNATLANALAHRSCRLSSVGGALRPGIVHRLDKDTSGVIVAAKNDICHASLASQFAGRAVGKEYCALVYGAVKKNSGVFSAAIGRSSSNRKKMSGRGPAKSRGAVTRWQVVEKFRNWTFVKITPETGRTHQIRVHFSEGGHPVAGDSLYSDKSARVCFSSSGLSKILRRQALHSSRITFLHPGSGKKASFSAPLPEDMSAALSFLRKRVSPEN